MINKLKQISKRAESWLNKPVALGGVWFETDANGNIVFMAKHAANGNEYAATLTLAQAKALRSLLNIELDKQKGN